MFRVSVGSGVAEYKDHFCVWEESSVLSAFLSHFVKAIERLEKAHFT